jgi:hypothetical protein
VRGSAGYFYPSGAYLTGVIDGLLSEDCSNEFSLNFYLYSFVNGSIGSTIGPKRRVKTLLYFIMRKDSVTIAIALWRKRKEKQDTLLVIKHTIFVTWINA